jgi:hypothetical protein
MTQEMGALIAAIRKIADNITPTVGGMIEAGTNTTLTGSGSLADPYVINADTSGTWFAPTAVIPTRASADDPTYTITFAGVDLTNIISEGFRISWKQNALTRYGFISKAPTYSAGNTTVTILTICGDASANYDVLDTGTYAISEVKFSAAKSPLGFPMSPTLWTVSLSDANYRVQATPTINTYYNLGSLSLAMPIGSWDVSFTAICELSKSTAMDMYGKAALSTSASSVSDTDLLTGLRGGDAYQWVAAYVQKRLSVTTKTTYYAIISTGSAIDNIMFRGDFAPTRIRMVSNYL